jgi:Leucine-rich repeat (LRR) protein
VAPSIGPLATAAPTNTSDFILAVDAIIFTISDDFTPGTPQYEARQWMLYEDYLRDDVVDGGTHRISQRYVMALFFFALLDESYILPDESVCDWDGVHCNLEDDFIVTSIVLDSKNLQGSLPTELGHLTFLEELNLSNNAITGELPSELGSLTTLNELDLSNNSFSKSIPPKLWSLPLLGVVFLNDNSLTGQIQLPDDSSSFAPNLLDVRLHGNDLSGPIPAWFSQLTLLKTWNAGGNQFTGILPTDPASSLSFLDFSWNNLTGPVPSKLLEQLTYLYLEHNHFTGRLPAVKTSSLKVLWLHENSLTGDVPSNFGLEWTNLKELLLHNNSELTGLLGPLNTSLCEQVWPSLKSATVDCSTVVCACCDC